MREDGYNKRLRRLFDLRQCAAPGHVWPRLATDPRHFHPTLALVRSVNPLLAKLQPYPFEKLRQLFAGVTVNPEYAPISLGMGEPKHPTPTFIEQALVDNIHGLASYPTTIGSEA